MNTFIAFLPSSAATDVAKISRILNIIQIWHFSMTNKFFTNFTTFQVYKFSSNDLAIGTSWINESWAMSTEAGITCDEISKYVFVKTSYKTCLEKN